jgi:HEAT repeat protein
MNDFFGLGVGTATESVLAVVIATTAALFAVSVAFSLYAIALRMGHRLRERRWENLTARWQQPLLSALMDPETESAVHAFVQKRDRRHFVRFVLEYSRRVRGEERQALRRLAMPYLDLIAERTDHRRSEIRTRAIQTLGTLGLPKYAPQVLEGLDDPSPLVSMVAARYLAREEFPEFAGPIIDHIHRFEGWHRRFLASMLAAIGPEVSPKLRDRLADPAVSSWVRAVMADALRMQLDPLAADLAAEALPGMEDRDLAAALLRLLAEVGRPEHAPIVRALMDSEDLVVRAQALYATGVLGDERDLPTLLEAMSDATPWVALHAARGVRAAGGLERLAELAASDDERADVAGQVVYEEGEG